MVARSIIAAITAPSLSRKLSLCAALLSAVLAAFLFSGCQAPATRAMTEEHTLPPVLLLAPGDAVEITFPGATNMSGIRRIGPEGTITLPLVGPVQAAGLTVADLEVDLEKRFEKELNDKDVVVAIAGSANVVYVSGSVARPGRVALDRPMTVLEAILEVGGFTPDANMKKVTISRYEENGNVTYSVDLKPLFEGGPVSRFYLKPRDVVYVPKKIQWF
jgi:polysaccharide biosynthesis/export protein